MQKLIISICRRYPVYCPLTIVVHQIRFRPFMKGESVPISIRADFNISNSIKPACKKYLFVFFFGVCNLISESTV